MYLTERYAKIIKIEMKEDSGLFKNTLQCCVLGFLEAVYGSLMWVYVCIRVYV